MSTQPAHEPKVHAGVRDAVEAAQERKAIDLRVLLLREVSDFTEHFVICSGASSRQVQAIADGIVERLKPQKVRPLSREGYRQGAWVLLDFGGFVAHVFTQETRTFYGLERLWSDAPDVTADFAS